MRRFVIPRERIIHKVLLAKSGTFFVSLERGSHEIHVWDIPIIEEARNVAHPQLRVVLSAGENRKITAISLTCDDKYVCAGCTDGTLALWDLVSPIPLCEHLDLDAAHNGGWSSLQCSPADSQRDIVAAVALKGWIKCWKFNPDSGAHQTLAIPVASDAEQTCVHLAPDCSMMGVGRDDGDYSVYHVQTGDSAFSIRLAPDSSMAADDSWHAPTGNLAFGVRSPIRTRIDDASFCPTRFWSLISQSSMTFLDLETRNTLWSITGSNVGSFRMSSPKCMSSAWFEDGNHLASGWDDGNIRVWKFDLL